MNRLRLYASIEQYENLVRSFHVRVAVFVRGFCNNECETIFRTTVPSCYESMIESEKNSVSLMFENAYNWVETQLVCRVNSYVQKW